MKRIILWSIFLAIAVTSMMQAQVTRKKPAQKAKGKQAVETLDAERRDKLMELIKQFLNETVNDPKRLQIVKVSNAIATKTAYVWRGKHDRESLDMREVGIVGDPPYRAWTWAPVLHPVEVVAVRYRTANALGSLVVMDSVFLIAKNKVVAEVQPDDFSPVHPKSRPSAKAARQREDAIIDDLFKSGGLK